MGIEAVRGTTKLTHRKIKLKLSTHTQETTEQHEELRSSAIKKEK
jgi:hypothetical protein